MSAFTHALKGSLIGFGIGTTGSVVNQMLGHLGFEALLSFDVLAITVCSVMFQAHDVDPAAFMVLPLFLMTQPRLIRGLQHLGRGFMRDILEARTESPSSDLGLSSSSGSSDSLSTSSSSGSSSEDLKKKII